VAVSDPDVQDEFFRNLEAQRLNAETDTAPPSSPAPARAPAARRDSPPNERRLATVPASEITIERTEWLWSGRIPAGDVTLLAGPPGLGKSMLTAWMAAANSRGELGGEPGATLIATAEDSPARTVVPRLLAWNADLNLVRFVHIFEGDEGD
jgi:hypothetical protein